MSWIGKIKPLMKVLQVFMIMCIDQMVQFGVAQKRDETGLVEKMAKL